MRERDNLYSRRIRMKEREEFERGARVRHIVRPHDPLSGKVGQVVAWEGDPGVSRFFYGFEVQVQFDHGFLGWVDRTDLERE
jgi:hypothetical protein